MAVVTHEIASASGLVFGFWFMLVLTGTIGLSTAVLGWKTAGRFPALDRLGMSRTLAVILGAGLFTILFSWIFLSSLAGFHRVDLREEGAVLHYALPPLEVGLSWSEIGEVRREPSYRGRWQLVFYRTHGARLESAHGGYREVKRAWLDAVRWIERADGEVIRDGSAVVRDL